MKTEKKFSSVPFNFILLKNTLQIYLKNPKVELRKKEVQTFLPVLYKIAE